MEQDQKEGVAHQREAGVDFSMITWTTHQRLWKVTRMKKRADSVFHGSFVIRGTLDGFWDGCSGMRTTCRVARVLGEEAGVTNVQIT
jgi:hypothetical protein